MGREIEGGGWEGETGVGKQGVTDAGLLLALL